MKLDQAIEWMKSGYFSRAICEETGRVVELSRNQSMLIDSRLDGSVGFAAPAQAILSPVEQVSANWSAYWHHLSQTTAIPILEMMTGPQVVLKEKRPPFEYYHRYRDGIVWTAKADGALESIRNWFPNWEFTRFLCGEYSVA